MVILHLKQIGKAKKLSKWVSHAAAAAKSLQSCPTLRPHRRQPARLPHPWDSPGKNTGVGCHFLLPCMKVKSESEVAQSCLTLCNPMDCSPPGSSIHGIFQARVLEWVPLPSPKPSLWPNHKENKKTKTKTKTIALTIIQLC